MIYPIIAYGHPVLRTRAQEINADHPGLSEIIANMYETMYNAKGVGLADQKSTRLNSSHSDLSRMPSSA